MIGREDQHENLIAAAGVLSCVFSLNAQITAFLKARPDGSNEVRVGNDEPVVVPAFAAQASGGNHVEFESSRGASREILSIVYVDSLIDDVPKPLQPNEERVVKDGGGLLWEGKRVIVTYELPIRTAGILADGRTFGDAELLRRLILRRCNMLQVVETSLDILSDAGRRNVSRDLLVNEFRKMADSLNRWYVPPELQLGHNLYQSMMGKLLNLPDEPPGSPFPPDSFVTQETATLNRLRVTLRDSQPSLTEAAVGSGVIAC